MNKDNVYPKGFFRIQITEDGKGVIGDSGWKKNQITNDGIKEYLVNWLVGDTGNGKSVTHLALGTGSQPASNGSSLEGEVEKRQAVSTSIVNSRTAQYTGAFNSADSFITQTETIRNLGLFNTSSGGQIFAGNTFATSTIATNQNVNCTYQIRFS